MTSTTALSHVVGSGSDAQLLSGSAWTAATTSSTQTGLNSRNDATQDIGRNSGGGRSNAVDLVIEVAVKLLGVDGIKRRNVTATEQRVDGTPKLAQ